MKREDFIKVEGFKEVLEILSTGICDAMDCDYCPFYKDNNNMKIRKACGGIYTTGEIPQYEFDKKLKASAEEFKKLFYTNKRINRYKVIKMEINKIKIPNEFALTPPKERKIKEKMSNIGTVYVSKDLFLLDGYASLIANNFYKCKEIELVMVDVVNPSKSYYYEFKKSIKDKIDLDRNRTGWREV